MSEANDVMLLAKTINIFRIFIFECELPQHIYSTCVIHERKVFTLPTYMCRLKLKCTYNEKYCFFYKIKIIHSTFNFFDKKLQQPQSMIKI